MSYRFFVQPLKEDVTHATLDGPEAHHLLHVMRGKVGDAVTLFDGSGYEFLATIEKLERSAVRLRVEERVEASRELARTIVLAVALPRGDRQEWLVEKAVELGVAELVPWQTQRSVALPNEKSFSRLQRGVIEASKQCGRNRLMAIHSPVTYRDYLDEVAREGAGHANLIAHPYAVGGPTASPNHADLGAASETVRIGIGPEGGFTDEEISAALTAGWKCLELGPAILRTETAALAAVAALTRP